MDGYSMKTALGLIVGLILIGAGAYLATAGATGALPVSDRPYPNVQHVSTIPSPRR